MPHRDNAMIDEIFRRLTVAPAGLRCSSGEVLTAAGLFISAIVDASFKDQAARQTWIDYLCWNAALPQLREPERRPTLFNPERGAA
jgi:hypothetical protein